MIGVLGAKARDRNSIIGVLMPFGLGLGILFLALYPGRSANKFGLLTGQIVSVDDPQLTWLSAISLVVLVGLLLIWRPLSFDSLDADVAAARGVPTRFVSLAFMVLLGLIVAVSVQIIGALLVLALLVTPAAAALRVSASPVARAACSAMLFGFVSAVGGILLAIGGSLPISPYITTISFVDLPRRPAGGAPCEAPARATLEPGQPRRWNVAVKRNTWQREAVREALDSRDGFVSAQGLHQGCATPAPPSGWPPSTARSPTSRTSAKPTRCSRRRREPLPRVRVDRPPPPPDLPQLRAHRGDRGHRGGAVGAGRRHPTTDSRMPGTSSTSSGLCRVHGGRRA